MKEHNYKLNMNTIPFEAFEVLNNLDRTFIGTPKYMGIAYFWGSNGIKHYMRETTIAERKRIHKAFLEAGLDLHGDSIEHYDIVLTITRRRRESERC